MTGSDDEVIRRLQSSGPVAGVGVDFDAVAGEVARRRRASRGLLAAAGSALTVVAVVVASQVLPRLNPQTLVPGGSTASVASRSAPAGSGSAPVAASEAAVRCPAAVAAPEVPAAPVGFALMGSLVPAKVPSSVVVCGYAVRTLTPGATPTIVAAPGPPYRLTAAVPVTAPDRFLRDAGLTRRWSGSVHPCPMAPSMTYYLVRLDYPDGTSLWLATADGACATVTNGDFTTDAKLAPALAATLATGRWGGLAVAGTPCEPTVGRLGSDTELVPGDGATVTICRARPGGGLDPVAVAPAAAERILTALAALHPQALGDCAVADTGSPDEAFFVVLRYPAGPDQVIALDPSLCEPVTTDLLKAADPGASVRAAVVAALAG